jgi:hypothetical protein
MHLKACPIVLPISLVSLPCPYLSTQKSSVLKQWIYTQVLQPVGSFRRRCRRRRRLICSLFQSWGMALHKKGHLKKLSCQAMPLYCVNSRPAASRPSIVQGGS